MSTANVIDPQTRLFLPFLDPVDMVGLFPADTTLAEVNRQAAEHHLHFPLWVDSERTLREHFTVVDHTPASTRFGAIVDNVPGMNWMLPSGRRVRVGERVIKSSTGYDLLRFLLHAEARYGQAAEYVLRLRPLGGERFAGIFEGANGALGAVVRTLRDSPWIHWIDTIEWRFSREGAFVTVTVDCLPGESDLFKNFFSAAGDSAGADFRTHAAPPVAGLPRFSIKSLPGQIPTLARLCLDELGGTVRALPNNGSLMIYPKREPSAPWLNGLRARVEPEGGHLLGIPCEADETESAWSTTLEGVWKNL
jgi:hypothetical protein